MRRRLSALPHLNGSSRKARRCAIAASGLALLTLVPWQLTARASNADTASNNATATGVSQPLNNPMINFLKRAKLTLAKSHSTAMSGPAVFQSRVVSPEGLPVGDVDVVLVCPDSRGHQVILRGLSRQSGQFQISNPNRLTSAYILLKKTGWAVSASGCSGPLPSVVEIAYPAEHIIECRDTSGRPISGVLLRRDYSDIFRNVGPNGDWCGKVFTRATNQHGVAVFRDDETWGGSISLTTPDYIEDSSSNREHIMWIGRTTILNRREIGRTRIVKRMVLRRVSVLSGKIVDEVTGKGVPGVNINAFPLVPKWHGGYSSAMHFTDNQGNFALQCHDAGTYLLVADSGFALGHSREWSMHRGLWQFGPFKVGVHQHIDGLTLQLRASGTVTIRTTDANGEPTDALNCKVFATKVPNKDAPLFQATDYETLPGGELSLPAGRYTVGVVHNLSETLASKEIVVKAKEHTIINFPVHVPQAAPDAYVQPPKLHVTVIGVDGQAQSNPRVMLFDEAFRPVYIFNRSYSSQVGVDICPEGLLGSAEPDQTKVSQSDTHTRAYTILASVGDSADSETIHWDMSKSADVTLRLKPHVLATVTGRVVSSAGNPIRGASVALTALDIASLPWPAQSHSDLTTTTDSNGVFQFTGVRRTTEYEPRTWASGYGHLPILPRKRHVGPFQSASVTDIGALTLPPLDDDVAGVILDTDGKPAWGARVQVAGNHTTPTFVTAGTTGRFRVPVTRGDQLWLGALTTTGNYGGYPIRPGDRNVVIHLDGAHHAVEAARGR